MGGPITASHPNDDSCEGAERLKGQEQTGFDCFASVFAEGFRPDDAPVAGAKR